MAIVTTQALAKVANQSDQPKKASALSLMASRLNVEPGKLTDALKATVFKNATNEELLALVVVSNEYGLNPFLKEIYAFPAKGGGIVPVVSVDGWIQIVNRQSNFDGVTFDWELGEDRKPVACTAKISIKGRTHPVEVTEWLSECARNTEPWNKMPSRMLRHRAFIQAARLAFGLSGINDEEEVQNIIEVEASPVETQEAPKRIGKASPKSQQASEGEPEREDDKDATSLGSINPNAGSATANKAASLAELERLMAVDHIDFNQLVKYAVESGHVANADSIPDINFFPSDKIAGYVKAWPSIRNHIKSA